MPADAVGENRLTARSVHSLSQYLARPPLTPWATVLVRVKTEPFCEHVEV